MNGCSHDICEGPRHVKTMKRIRRSTTSTSSTTEEQEEGHRPKWRELSSSSSGDDEEHNDTSSTLSCSESNPIPSTGVHEPSTSSNKAICPMCHTTFKSPTKPHSTAPASYLLDLHITERHDPISAIKRDERGEKIYRCFVKNCDKVCWEVKKRRWHVEAKHPGFWGEGKWDWSLRGLGRKREHQDKVGKQARQPRFTSQRAVPGQKSQERASPGNTQKEGDGMDDVMGTLTNGFSALSFVPPSVRFGRGGRRGGLAKG